MFSKSLRLVASLLLIFSVSGLRFQKFWLPNEGISSLDTQSFSIVDGHSVMVGNLMADEKGGMFLQMNYVNCQITFFRGNEHQFVPFSSFTVTVNVLQGDVFGVRLSDTYVTMLSAVALDYMQGKYSTEDKSKMIFFTIDNGQFIVHNAPQPQAAPAVAESSAPMDMPMKITYL